jgi:GH43 family beta-xylosidase
MRTRRRVAQRSPRHAASAHHAAAAARAPGTRRRAARHLHEPGDRRRPPGSVGHPGRQRVLGHGDHLAVGAGVPAAALHRSRELDARGRRVRDAARLVGRQLLGPEIDHHEGRFSIFYTARKKNGPLCVAVATATHPAGPYTDHGPMVCQEVGSIDAVAITDEDGRRYLVWKEDGNSRKLPTPLWAQRLDAGGITLVGERHELLRNEAPWEGHLIEGPFIVRRNGWFYMFYSAGACCGRRCDYRLGVARARALLGPWERNPANPILAGNEHWRCPGHGSIVTDPRGRDFLLYHAYHPNTFEYAGDRPCSMRSRGTARAAGPGSTADAAPAMGPPRRSASRHGSPTSASRTSSPGRRSRRDGSGPGTGRLSGGSRTGRSCFARRDATPRARSTPSSRGPRSRATTS